MASSSTQMPTEQKRSAELFGGAGAKASFDFMHSLQNLSGEHALVTGGCGFVGVHIVELLLCAGAHVTVYDLSVEREKFRSDAVTNERLRVVKGDLLDLEQLTSCCKNVSVVIHVAALFSHTASAELFERVNVTGTSNVIQACKAESVRALVFTSSASVAFAGSSARNIRSEDVLPLTSLDNYTQSKSRAEKLVLSAGDAHLNTVAIRPHGIFGPGDPNLLPATAKAGKDNKSRYIVGTGTSVADFTFVGNVAYAHVLAAARLLSDKKSAHAINGKAYFITNLDPVLFWDFMSELQYGLGYSLPRLTVPLPLMQLASHFSSTLNPQRVAYAAVDHYFDSSAAVADLGYHAPIPMESAIEASLRSNPELGVPEHERPADRPRAVEESNIIGNSLLLVFTMVLLCSWMGYGPMGVAIPNVLRYFGLLAALLICLRRYLRDIVRPFTADQCGDSKISQRTVLITGGNRGIGLAVAIQFARLGAHVVIACRNVKSANEAAQRIRDEGGKGKVEIVQLDLASFDSVRALVRSWRSKALPAIDYLICNAGCMLGPGKTVDGLDQNLQVNHLGHFLLTNLLLEHGCMSSTARIVHVSSWMHEYGHIGGFDIMQPFDRFHDRSGGYARFPSYCASKLCQVLFNGELHRRLRAGVCPATTRSKETVPSRICTIAVHPGNGDTDFVNHFIPEWLHKLASAFVLRFFILTSWECGHSVMFAALHRDMMGVSGHYSQAGTFARASAIARDRVAQHVLWKESEEAVGGFGL